MRHRDFNKSCFRCKCDYCINDISIDISDLLNSDAFFAFWKDVRHRYKHFLQSRCLREKKQAILASKTTVSSFPMLLKKIETKISIGIFNILEIDAYRKY